MKKHQYRNIYFLAGFLHYTLETCWLGGSFFMVYRNNAGRLGSGLHQCVLGNSLAGSKQRFLCARTTLYLFIFLSICLSVCLSDIYQSVSTVNLSSLCLSVGLSLSVCVPVYVSFCLGV